MCTSPGPNKIRQRFEADVAARQAAEAPAVAPPPLMQDATVMAARALQRRRQKAAGGYGALTTPGMVAPAAPAGKTLLGA